MCVYACMAKYRSRTGVYMCVCVCVCMHVWRNIETEHVIYMCVCVCMCVYACMAKYRNRTGDIHVCVYVCVCICMYAYIYVMHIYLYVCNIFVCTHCVCARFTCVCVCVCVCLNLWACMMTLQKYFFYTHAVKHYLYKYTCVLRLRVFLNRILGVRVKLQNQIFALFSDLLQVSVDTIASRVCAWKH
jgi:hypothetical protein